MRNQNSAGLMRDDRPGRRKTKIVRGSQSQQK